MSFISRGDGPSPAVVRALTETEPEPESEPEAKPRRSMRPGRWADWPAWTAVPVDLLNLDAFSEDGEVIADPLRPRKGGAR